MAWTDYSSTLANGYDASLPAAVYDDTITVQLGDEVTVGFVGVNEQAIVRNLNSLAESYNIPGYDDGYQPLGVNNPINKDLGGGSGGGGPTRPTSGFLYPRGQG